MSRATYLQFRDPAQQTPEFRITKVMYDSQKLSYEDKNSPDQVLRSINKQGGLIKGSRQRKMVVRPEKSPPHSSSPPLNRLAFVGPGSYDGAQQHNKLLQQPCSAVLKKCKQTGPTESSQAPYIMVGSAKKYQAGLLKNYGSKDVIQNGGFHSQKAIIQDIGNHPLQKPSMTNAMDLQGFNMVRRIKKIRKARRLLLYNQLQAQSSQDFTDQLLDKYKVKRSKNVKQFTQGLSSMEQTAQLYEIYPEVPITQAIAKQLQATPANNSPSQKRSANIKNIYQQNTEKSKQSPHFVAFRKRSKSPMQKYGSKRANNTREKIEQNDLNLDCEEIGIINQNCVSGPQQEVYVKSPKNRHFQKITKISNESMEEARLDGQAANHPNQLINSKSLNQKLVNYETEGEPNQQLLQPNNSQNQQNFQQEKPNVSFNNQQSKNYLSHKSLRQQSNSLSFQKNDAYHRNQQKINQLTASSAFRKSLNSAYNNYGRGQVNQMTRLNHQDVSSLNNINSYLELQISQRPNCDDILEPSSKQNLNGPDLFQQFKLKKREQVTSYQRPLSQHKKNMAESDSGQRLTKQLANNKKYITDRAQIDIDFLSENNTKSYKHLISTDYINQSSPLTVTQTRPKTSVSTSYVGIQGLTQKQSHQQLRQQRRFQVAHRSSSIAIPMPANLIRATSGQLSSHFGRISFETASRIRLDDLNLEAPLSTQDISPKVKRQIKSGFRSPLQNITKEIDRHYKQIERLERQKRRQEQIMLMKEQQRDLNDLNDQEIKLNLFREFQNKRLQRYKKIEKYYNMQLPQHNIIDENEPLLDLLSVRNPNKKSNKDHNINTVFGRLPNKDRNKSQSHSREPSPIEAQKLNKKTPNIQSNQVTGFNNTQTNQIISDTSFKSNKETYNKQGDRFQSQHVQQIDSNQIYPDKPKNELKQNEQDPQLQVQSKKLTNQTNQLNIRNQSLQSVEIYNQVGESQKNVQETDPTLQKSSMSTQKDYQAIQSQDKEPLPQNLYQEESQEKEITDKPMLYVKKDPSDSQPRPTGHFQNNWAFKDDERVQSSLEGSQKPNETIKGTQQLTRPVVNIEQSSQKNNLSAINLNKVNEENEVRIESASLNDGEFTVMARSAVVKQRRKNKSDNELHDGTGSLTKSPHSNRVQNINNVDLILDSEREEVVSKNLNYLSEQIQKEGDHPDSEEVTDKMKQIMNMLGQALVDNFKKKKPNQHFTKFDNNNLRVPNSNETSGFTQSLQNDRPLLVKDIRAKMGQEIVKLMQKYKMKKSFEKTVKELMSKEILKLVKAKRLEAQVMQKSVLSKGTDRTRQISRNDPVINIEDDDVNLTTIGDAQIELADLERLVNRDDQITLQPEIQQIIQVQNDVETKSEFEQVFEKVKADQESLLRHGQNQLVRGYSPNPKSGDEVSGPGHFNFFEPIIAHSSQKPHKTKQKFNHKGFFSKEKNNRKRSGLPMPDMNVEKEDRSIHAVSQYFPATKSHYSPEENVKRMTPQHRGSDLLPNLNDVNNQVNEFKSVGPQFQLQSQIIPPSKSSNQQMRSQLPRTQNKSFQKNIKKDPELTIKFKNQDLSEFIDAEIMSSGKFNGTPSQLTQSKSRPKKFSQKLEEQKHIEGDSGSFFSATVKNFQQDVLIESHINNRKIVDMTSSDHQQSQEASSVTLERAKPSHEGISVNVRLQNQASCQTGWDRQLPNSHFRDETEANQVQEEVAGDEASNREKNSENLEVDNQIITKIEQLDQRLILLANTLKQLDAQRFLSQELLNDLEQKLGSVEAASISENFEAMAVVDPNLLQSNKSQLQEELKVVNTTYGGPSSLTKTEKNNYLQDQGISMRTDDVLAEKGNNFEGTYSIVQEMNSNKNDEQQINDSKLNKDIQDYTKLQNDNKVKLENKDVSLKVQYQQQKKIFKNVDKQIESLQQQMEQTLMQLASLNRENYHVQNQQI